MAIDWSLAAHFPKVEPPDLARSLTAAAQAGLAQSNIGLNRFKLEQAVGGQNALDTYAANQATDPNAIQGLARYPEHYRTALENEMKHEADQKRKTADDASYLLSLDPTRQNQAWGPMLDRAHNEKRLPSLTHQELTQVTDPTERTRILKGFVERSAGHLPTEMERAHAAHFGTMPLQPGGALVNVSPTAGVPGTVLASQPIKPPPGYENDPINPGGYRPITGGPADIKFTEAKNKSLFSVQSSVSKMDELIQNIRRLKTHPGLAGNFGLYGALPNIPGSESSDAYALLQQLKASGGFSMLQAMRDASKSGGALGNVSDAEGQRLEAAFGALQRTSSIKQALREMDKIERLTGESRERIIQAFNRQYGASTTPAPTPTRTAPGGEPANPPANFPPGMHGSGAASSAIPEGQPGSRSSPAFVRTPQEAIQLPPGVFYRYQKPDGSFETMQR